MAQKLEVEVGADLSPLKKDLNTARDDIKGFKERTKSDRAVELSVKVAELKSQLQNVKSLINSDIPKAVEIKLQAKSEVLKQEITQASRELRNFLRTGQEDISVFGKLVSGIGGTVKSSFGAIGPAIAGAFAVTGIKNFSDEVTNMSNSLKQIATGEELDALKNRILKLANESRVPVAQLADSFVRYDKVIKAMGGNQEQTFVIMDSLSKSLISTGRSASETSSIMLQLSQAFASGKLQGDEFRSLSENMPGIMDILAKSMNVPRGQLKDLASDGKITATVLRDALIQANADINDQFNKSSVTIGQALTQVRNSLLVAFGNFDEATGFTQKIVDIIGWLDKLVSFLGTTEGKATTFGVAITLLTGLFAALIPILGGVSVAFTTAAASGGVLAGVLAAIGGPITLISVGLGLLGAGAFYAYEHFNGLTGATGDLQSQLNTLQSQQEENNKAFEKGAMSQEEYTRKTEENKAAQDQLKGAIDEVTDGTLTYETVKNRINGLTKIADVDGYNRETSAIQAQIAALKELMSIKATQSKAALASWKSAKGQETLMTGQGSLMGNETTQEQLDNSMKAFEEYQKQNAEYQKLQNEVAITEKAFADAQKAHAENQKKLLTQGGGGGGGGGDKKKKGGGQSAEKKLLEAQKKLLEDKAKNEIIAVNKSEMSEIDKAKKIIAINTKLKEDLKLLEGDYTEVQAENAKKVVEDEKKRIEGVKKYKEDYYKETADLEAKQVENIKKAAIEYGKYKDSFTEKTKKMKEDVESLNKAIEDIEKKLSENVTTGQVDIAKRVIEAKKELKEINEKSELYTEDVLKRIELQKEIDLGTKNTTTEAMAEATKSETQLIIDRVALKKKELEDDLLAAIKKRDEKKLEYETDLANLKSKMEATATYISTETNLIAKADFEKRKIEQEYTNFFGGQIETRKNMLDDLVSKAREAASALKDVGISSASVSGLAEGNSTSTNTINVTNNNAVDSESFFRTLNSKFPTK